MVLNAIWLERLTNTLDFGGSLIHNAVDLQCFNWAQFGISDN